MFSLQHTYMSSSYRFNRLGLSHWDPYAVHRGGCLELYYCNMVEWFWWHSSLILTTNWFPSVLWHCWFGHLASKNCPRNDLLCVEWDVKPYTLTHSVPACQLIDSANKLAIVKKKQNLNQHWTSCSSPVWTAHMSLHNYTLIHIRTQNSSDNICFYPADNHRWSDAVCWRGEKRLRMSYTISATVELDILCSVDLLTDHVHLHK